MRNETSPDPLDAEEGLRSLRETYRMLRYEGDEPSWWQLQVRAREARRRRVLRHCLSVAAAGLLAVVIGWSLRSLTAIEEGSMQSVQPRLASADPPSRVPPPAPAPTGTEAVAASARSSEQGAGGLAAVRARLREMRQGSSSSRPELPGSPALQLRIPPRPSRLTPGSMPQRSPTDRADEG